MAKTVFLADGDHLVTFNMQDIVNYVREVLGQDLIDVYNEYKQEEEILEKADIDSEYEIITDERYQQLHGTLDSLQELCDYLTSHQRWNKEHVLKHINQMIKELYNEL